jgi:plasmid replication initiation protein
MSVNLYWGIHMTNAKPALDAQFDFFVPYVADLSLRDQRETMERPFFSLAKRKRLKPIEYVSPDGGTFVNVYPNQEFGMATIWDADILIWAASYLNDMKRKGQNDIPRTIKYHPHDLLKAIGRRTGGRQYHLLREGLGRLQSTTVVTNIRAHKGKKQRQFSWIESWTDHMDEDTGMSKGMSVTLADWFYEGILMDGGVLAIDPQYFTITGGRERWLYRVARKHAGGAGETGFAIGMATLFEKSGAEGQFRRFKYEILKIVRENAVPQYHFCIEGTDENPLIRMTRRSDLLEPDKPTTMTRKKPRARPQKVKEHLPQLPFPNHLTEQTILLVRENFPGWDIYALKAQYDTWITEKTDRAPTDYNKAFFGFVRSYDKANR